MRASEIRVNDALNEVFLEIEANFGRWDEDKAHMERSIRLTVELMAQRLLTDAAMTIGENYPKIRHASNGGQYTTPTRVELSNMIQDL